MNIVIRIQSNFGNNVAYPVCDTAVSFSNLLKKKTFSRRDLARIELLGYEVKVQSETINSIS